VIENGWNPDGWVLSFFPNVDITAVTTFYTPIPSKPDEIIDLHMGRDEQAPATTVAAVAGGFGRGHRPGFRYAASFLCHRMARTE